MLFIFGWMLAEVRFEYGTGLMWDLKGCFVIKELVEMAGRQRNSNYSDKNGRQNANVFAANLILLKRTQCHQPPDNENSN